MFGEIVVDIGCGVVVVVGYCFDDDCDVVWVVIFIVDFVIVFGVIVL